VHRVRKGTWQWGSRAAFWAAANCKIDMNLEKREQQLKQANPNNCNLCRGTANWPELEKELKIWILDQRRSGITVSTKMIIHPARLLATDRNFIALTGSPSWCFRFMKRNNLCMQAKTKISQKMPAE
jgi:hypothetical protein